jgi:hypothetical protein
MEGGALALRGDGDSAVGSGGDTGFVRSEGAGSSDTSRAVFLQMGAASIVPVSGIVIAGSWMLSIWKRTVFFNVCCSIIVFDRVQV